MLRRAILLPGAIIIAGLIIAVAVYIVRKDQTAVVVNDASMLRPVSPQEHVVGNPTAPVVVVTYSDLDCAYCKQFDRTMSQVMTDYGAGGQVAWVYRHMPILAAHPASGLHAEASECVASLGGEEAFWRFIDLMHASAPGANEFDPDAYSTLLAPLGIGEEPFERCMDAGRFVKKVEADLRNALEIGATAAPYSVIVVSGKEPLPLSGTLTYPEMKTVIDQAIAEVTPR